MEAILESNQTVEHLTRDQKNRPVNNEHMAGRRVEDRPVARVFLADEKHSRRSDRAVDLEV